MIWAETRSASAALAAALRAVSNRSALEDEPFLYNTPRVHGHVYTDWLQTHDDAPLRRLLAERPGIKYIAEPFDDTFNIALAHVVTEFGYRHIRLDRHNVFAQLASRGVAEQLDAWEAQTARRRFKRVAEGKPFADGKVRTLGPFDVEDLLRKRMTGLARWNVVSATLPGYLTLWTEDFTSTQRERRWNVLVPLFKHLQIHPSLVTKMDEVLFGSGQETERVLPRVPNVAELLAVTL
jgi:hypothetical protein